MSKWPDLIALGWPGAEFTTDTLGPDENALKRRFGDDQLMLREFKRDFEAMLEKVAKDNPNMLVFDDCVVIWQDKNVKMPTKAEVLARKAELQAIFDGRVVKIQQAKTLKQAWPHERILEAAKDDKEWNKLRQAALAVG